jgi:hypothetical protein
MVCGEVLTFAERPLMTRTAALYCTHAFVFECEDHKAGIHARTLAILVHSSMNAKIKKRTSMPALFNFFVQR